MKFTVTPAFTRETEQQPRGTAINPEKYRRCMRLRIESIKWFLLMFTESRVSVGLKLGNILSR
ncbi:hypothetical protein P5673_002565 [Acropora cervicornis]|uniref:Uncharacterized protein n=1 Tax=Acropora cervicornis TaxID=6130 RepID=A0AAD9R3H4_ACRCE|nr:hypothetical protein P5673_002565 [Acropora cervicornis]